VNEHVAGLKEALDYTRLYRDQIFVIKLGGEVVASAEALDEVAIQIALLESLSIRVVVVHGGGPQATELSRRLGLEPEIVAGRRVTSPEVLEVAKMVYAGRINVDVLAALRAHKVPAVGLSGIDAGLVTTRRRPPVTVRDDDGGERLVDFGEVGDVESVDPSLIELLLPRGYVPVVASLAADAEGRPLNINADTLAEALARALGAKKLIYLTGAPGLLRDPNDPSSLVAFAGPEELEAMLASGAVIGGMRPKVEACLRAVAGGVRRTHIIDGRVPDALLVEVFTGSGSGTMIVAEVERGTYAGENR
jgi:acetylglutamate kinase